MDPTRFRIPRTRRLASYHIREEAATSAFHRPHPDHFTNGEEAAYRAPNGELSYVANYSKGLPHNRFGEVSRSAYRSLLRALYSGDPNDFVRIGVTHFGGLPSGRNLTNPQAGLAFDLEGPDAHALAIPPAPRIDEPENSAEMGELYWMALLRDVDFRDYGTGANTDASGGAAAAATSLSTSPLVAGGEFTQFRGPKVGDAVTAAATPAAGGNPYEPATLFRGFTPGDLFGPYVSQFLLQDIVYGTLLIPQRQRTVSVGTDFMTAYQEWLMRQRGVPPAGEVGPTPGPPFLHIRNLRDLATYVHFDQLYEAYLNA